MNEMNEMNEIYEMNELNEWNLTLQGLCKSFAYGGCEGKFIPRFSL